MCFLSARRKENRKKKIENRKKRKVPTMQCKCTGLIKYANVSTYITSFILLLIGVNTVMLMNVTITIDKTHNIYDLIYAASIYMIL